MKFDRLSNFFVEGRVTNILDSSMGTNILLPPFEIILTHSKTFYVTKDIDVGISIIWIC